MNTKSTPQAYKQAPWRRQMQVIGGFMLVLIVLATISGLFLSISGRAAASGRRIQQLEMRAHSLSLEINDLRTHLAQVSSANAMKNRIESLNMQTIDPHTAIYLAVPGYDPNLRNEAQEAKEQEVEKSGLLPEYTSSLWTWLREKIWTNSPGIPTEGEVAP